MQNYNKVPVIILSVKPHKEHDKLALAFSAEFGKINVLFKGASKKGAKLNNACQAFCFTELTLNCSNDFFTATGAEIIDSFFDLTYNIDKYFCAGLVLEICDASLQFRHKNSALFLTALKAMQELCYSKTDAYIIAAKFMLEALKACGYMPKFGACVNCSNKTSPKLFFDAEAGGMLCNICRRTTSVFLSFENYKLLKNIFNTDFSKLGNIAAETPVYLAKSIAESLQNLFDVKLRFFDNIINND